MTVSFVHGHARATGWVIAHVRRPTTAEDGQLPLLAAVSLPRPPEAEELTEPEPEAVRQGPELRDRAQVSGRRRGNGMLAR